MNGQTISFFPTGMNNSSPTGPSGSNVVAVVGYVGGNIGPSWWDGSSTHSDIPVGDNNTYPIAINSATATVNGQTVPAFQMLGLNNDAGEMHIWNMNAVTGKFGSPILLQSLLSSNAGWSFLHFGNTINPEAGACHWPYINDNGVVVCAATKNSDSTTHGLLLCPMQVVSDTNNNHQVDSTDNVLSYVRFGLWDNAFSSTSPTTVLNGSTETTNFVGSDSRRFYLRVVDPSANQDPGTAETITVNWYTQTGAGVDDDHPGATGQPSGVSTLTLTETGANTGVFVSKALMLVSDDVDNAQTTDPGSGNTGGAWHAINHRLRRAALGDQMCFSYTPAATGSQNTVVSVPIFNPSSVTSDPDRIDNMTVQIVNLYGGTTFTKTQSADYVTAIESNVAAHYAQAGIKVNFKYSEPTDDVPIFSSTKVDLNAVAGGSGGSTGDEGKVASIAKSHYPGADPHTIFLILIQQFAKDPISPYGPLDYNQQIGEAFSEGEVQAVPGFAPALHCSFVARIGLQGQNPPSPLPTQDSTTTCVPSHELGHQLTGQTADDIGNNNHYDGITQDQNLMRASAGDPLPGSVLGSKRLWDDSSHKYISIPITNQIDFMRQSDLLQ